jgi:hypothetical protein
VLRFLLWRLLGLLALLSGVALVGWFLRGGPGRLLRGSSANSIHSTAVDLLIIPASAARASWNWAPLAGIRPARALLELGLAQIACVAIVRWSARRRRRYVRLYVEAYRSDQASADAVVRMFDTVQFLDRPGGSKAAGDEPGVGVGGGDGQDDDELVGVGAAEAEVSF